ncbi:hypothetical protein [Mycolicibacterium sp. PDY-3]|uniref:hypothetical protein n=1 Tax=Mycolicibacterium sp. PDY-3 TaxID=3376069 RepID=UPI00378EC8BC
MSESETPEPKDEPSEPAGPADGETPAEVETPEPVVPAEQANPKRSLEAWFKARENILKGAAVIISVCAVGATGASATAAWYSWRTATAAEEVARTSADIAQRTLDTAGAATSIDPYLYTRRDCNSPEDTQALFVPVRNSGRLPTRITRFLVTVRSESRYYIETMDELNEPIVVPAQDGVDVELTIKCASVFEWGFNDFASFPTNGEDIMMKVQAEYGTGDYDIIVPIDVSKRAD